MCYRLRTLEILVVVGPPMLAGGCINANNFGTIHLPPACRAGQDVKMELELSMHGAWPGGRRSHVDSVECMYRVPSDSDFIRKRMTFDREVNTGLHYSAALPLPTDAAIRAICRILTASIGRAPVVSDLEAAAWL